MSVIFPLIPENTRRIAYDLYLEITPSVNQPVTDVNLNLYDLNGNPTLDFQFWIGNNNIYFKWRDQTSSYTCFGYEPKPGTVNETECESQINPSITGQKNFIQFSTVGNEATILINGIHAGRVEHSDIYFAASATLTSNFLNLIYFENAKYEPIEEDENEEEEEEEEEDKMPGWAIAMITLSSVTIGAAALYFVFKPKNKSN